MWAFSLTTKYLRLRRSRNTLHGPQKLRIWSIVQPALPCPHANNREKHIMQEITANVSWIAVIAGAVISFIIGWLWYSPKLFGTKWAEGVGVDLGKVDEMPMGAMLYQAAGLLLMSWFVSVTAGNNALLTVILATVAFSVMLMAGGKFAGHSSYANHVNAGYWIVALVVMIICNGIF